MDASGSMKGFERHVPRFSEWSAQALSQVRSLGTVFDETRYCYFSKSRGIAPCSADSLPGGVQAAGDTNLHEAIASAADYDLSVILTDGVAAMGQGSGDCAGGVDAACVGRALRRVLSPRPGEPQTVKKGVWLAPMAALFDGPLYTEQPPPDGFSKERAIGNVRSETATTAEIGQSWQDANGRLVYAYKGPRTLFALIVARDAGFGRAFVAAWASRSEGLLVSRISSLREFQQGLAVLAPIELYPGYVPPVEWGGIRKAVRNNQIQECGTIDVESPASGVVRLTCPADASALVEVDTKPQMRAAGCLDLQVLPPIQFERRDPPGFGRIEGEEWEGSLAEAGKPLKLALAVSCAKAWQATCGAGAPAAQWVGRPEFARSADLLYQPSPGSTAAAAVVNLTTNQVAAMPHRVFALRETLEKFYRELEGQTAELEFARLAFCKEQ